MKIGIGPGIKIRGSPAFVFVIIPFGCLNNFDYIIDITFKYLNMEQEEHQELTAEEIKERQKLILEHYESQLPFLKVHKEYQTLVTEIEELRMRQVYAQSKIAQILAPPPEEDPLPQENPPQIVPPHERKLRKETVH